MLLLVLRDAISVYLGDQGVYTVALVTVSEALKKFGDTFPPRLDDGTLLT